MANPLLDTICKLQELAQRRDSILVSFSGGKDSLCILSLCCRYFRRVEAFYMYLVPGLRHIEERLAYARARWEVPIRQYPHPHAVAAFKSGVFCDPQFDLLFDANGKRRPDLKLAAIQSVAMEEAGIDLIANGGKRCDSLWRKRSISAGNWKHQHYYPLEHWGKWDVMAYLSSQKIPAPPDESSRSAANGTGLYANFLLWVHGAYPDDFARIRRVFPHIDAVIHRKRHFGIPA